MGGKAFVEVLTVKPKAAKAAGNPRTYTTGVTVGNLRHIAARRDMIPSKQIPGGRRGRPLCAAGRPRTVPYYDRATFERRCRELGALFDVAEAFTARPVCSSCRARVEELRATCIKVPYRTKREALAALDEHNAGGGLDRTLTRVHHCRIHNAWHTTSRP